MRPEMVEKMVPIFSEVRSRLPLGAMSLGVPMNWVMKVAEPSDFILIDIVLLVGSKWTSSRMTPLEA